MQKSPIPREKIDNVVYEDMGEFMISSEEVESFFPLFCPVCDIVMSTSDDHDFIQKFQCCAECGMRWAEPMREKWVAGWRPDDNEIKSHREKIKQIPPFFYF